MRFELFLTELPKAPLAKVQDALAELPKGASTGTIIKSMEARKIPTVSIAWSDDKRVLNEVMDTLVDLGAGVKLVDHGSLVQKLATFAAEKAGRARYLDDDDDDESRNYIKMKQGKKGASAGEELTRHALIYFLQLCATSVLFLWFVALRVGMERVFTTLDLWTQLGACALGLLVTYVCTASVRAVQAGRMSVPRILPQMIAGGALTIASLFFLGDSFDKEQAADGKVKRPPSLPYAGLISELQRRKLKAEVNGGEGANEQAEAAADGAEEEEELLWCEKPDPVEAPACEGGPAWEAALACLPVPTRVKEVKRTVVKRRRNVPAEPVVELAEPLVEREPAERPWGVTLGASTVIALVAMWLLSLLGLFLQLKPRLGAKAGVEARGSAREQNMAKLDDLSEAPDDVLLGSTALAQAITERDALKSELDSTKVALAAAHAASSDANDEEQFATMQRELELARSTLDTSQVTIADLKRELAHVREELAQGAEQREQLRSTLMELRARRLDTRADNDTGEQRGTGTMRQPQVGDRGTGTMRQPQPAERGTGTMRQPQPAERGTGTMRQPQPAERNTGLTRQLAEESEASSYSVSHVQEERVSLGKRQKP